MFKDTDLFWDREHLNGAGAEVFSRLVAEQLRLVSRSRRPQVGSRHRQ